MRKTNLKGEEMTPSIKRNLRLKSILAVGAMAASSALYSAPALADTDLSKLAGNDAQVELKVFDGCYVVENGGNTPILVPHGSKDELLLHDNSFQRNLDDMRHVGFWECPPGSAVVDGARIYTSDTSTYRGSGNDGESFGVKTIMTPDASRIAVGSRWSSGKSSNNGGGDYVGRVQIFDLGEDGTYKFHSQIKGIGSEAYKGGKLSSMSDDGEYILTGDYWVRIFHWDGSSWVKQLDVKQGTSNTYALYDMWARMNPAGNLMFMRRVNNDSGNTSLRTYVRSGSTWSQISTTINNNKGQHRIEWLGNDRFVSPEYTITGSYPNFISTTKLHIYKYDPDNPSDITFEQTITGVGEDVPSSVDFLAPPNVPISIVGSDDGSTLVLLYYDGGMDIIRKQGGVWKIVGKIPYGSPIFATKPALVWSGGGAMYYPQFFDVNGDGTEVYTPKEDGTGIYIFTDDDGDGLWEAVEDLEAQDYPLWREEQSPSFITNLGTQNISVSASSDGAAIAVGSQFDTTNPGLATNYEGSVYIYGR
jgi:hypothetical protein